MQACEYMDLCAVSFEIILPSIWINLVVKVLEDPILFLWHDAGSSDLMASICRRDSFVNSPLSVH